MLLNDFQPLQLKGRQSLREDCAIAERAKS